jgi:hypothetical protein
LSQAIHGESYGHPQSICSYVIRLALSSGGCRSVFPGKCFGNSEISGLSIFRISLHLSPTPADNTKHHIQEVISGFLETEPRISTLEIGQINSQRGPQGIILPIFVTCSEATPVILSLSPLDSSDQKVIDCEFNPNPHWALRFHVVSMPIGYHSPLILLFCPVTSTATQRKPMALHAASPARANKQ